MASSRTTSITRLIYQIRTGTSVPCAASQSRRALSTAQSQWSTHSNSQTRSCQRGLQPEGRSRSKMASTGLFLRRNISTTASLSQSSFSSSSTSAPSTPPQLTHTDPETGRASMVSVTDKAPSHRTALAVSSIWLPGLAFDLLKRNAHKKGDVLTVAQIAGIQAAKQTSNLIPLCHPLLLTHVSVDLKLVEDKEEGEGLKGGRVEIESRVACKGNTGVEMEALTGATVAALTVFDMCKAVGKDMVIGDIKVMEKTGGKSGVYKHQQEPSKRQSHGI